MLTMTPIHLRAEYWGIEVPEGIQGKAIIYDMGGNASLGYYCGLPRLENIVEVKLPNEKWEIVCLSKEVTAAIAVEITGVHESIPFLNFYEILHSKRLDTNNTLILKKTENE